ALFEAVTASPEYAITVDLAGQRLVLADGREVPFEVDGFARQCLLDGVDELGWILQQDGAIRAFEAQRAGSINTLAQQRRFDIKTGR
ncbi:MAG: hypothetical protein GY953_25125, partial [bacterium]|nr:hypothetical protein [bacterium]